MIPKWLWRPKCCMYLQTADWHTRSHCLRVCSRKDFRFTSRPKMATMLSTSDANRKRSFFHNTAVPSNQPLLYKMDIFQLRKFVAAEKIRSLELNKNRKRRNRHMLLPGEYFHEDLCIKELGTCGRGVVSASNDLIRLGTVVVEAKGIPCETIETIDIFSSLLTDLCSSRRDRRRAALKYAKNFVLRHPFAPS